MAGITSERGGSMHVEGLWRYPVKSLGGEPLERTELTMDGVRGDRCVHVSGGVTPLTGRTRHGLLTVPASTGADGTPLVAGHRWTSLEAHRLVQSHAGAEARLIAHEGPERFDVTNLLVATDSAVAELGVSVRRLRPNILLAGVPRGAERTWAGRALAIGEALVGILNLRRRCIVTTIDPETGDQDLEVLRRINDHFGGRIALNCWVIRPGTVALGDHVTLVDGSSEPEHVGGWIVGAPYL